MKRLNCFIACAFGKEDVDEIYYNCIQSTLKQLDINPLRVDKIDFIGKVDLKILGLIKKADFCIADLSYARPSVYYEAGFCEGLNKKVIYTARKDHFHPKESDVNGNLKIHFDLITQNIIEWVKPDEKFSKVLKNRIKLVTEPINSKISEIAKFNTYSIVEKISEINKVAKQYATELNYVPHNTTSGFYYSSLKDNNYLWVITRNNFTKNQLDDIYPYSRKTFNSLEHILLTCQIPNNSNFTVIVNTLKQINSASIESVFDLFQRHHTKKEFYYNKDIRKILYRYIFLDGIESTSDYLKRLSMISRI